MSFNRYRYFTTGMNFKGSDYSSILRTPYFGEYSIWDTELKRWEQLSESAEDRSLIRQHSVEIPFEEIQKYAPEILLKPKVGDSVANADNHGDSTVSWADAASLLGIIDFGDPEFNKKHGAFRTFFFRGDRGSLSDLERYIASIGAGKTLRKVEADTAHGCPKFCCSSYSQSFCMVSEQNYQITQILESRGFRSTPVSESTIWHDLITSGKKCSLQNLNDFQDCLFRLYREKKVSLHHDENGGRSFTHKPPVIQPRRGRKPKFQK